jgi:hypothetical protein
MTLVRIITLAKSVNFISTSAELHFLEMRGGLMNTNISLYLSEAYT